MDRSRYPADWEAISKRIRERAGNCCEWCGLANGSYGYRDDKGEFHQCEPSQTGVLIEMGERNFFFIVLTVAHLGAPHADGRPGDVHDKMDCRDENLAALCQRCHLNYDRDEHVFNAAWTRRKKRIEAGQMELL
jgi:hypothetical protein